LQCKAVAFKPGPEFHLSAALLTNARIVAETLVSRGLRIISGRTESHVMLVDLLEGITGKRS
jgi:glycine hydroxymethyltransferase